jgi:tetratricopeptide (TPR) repeat protein
MSVGLVMVASNDVDAIKRSILSVRDMVDCITVVALSGLPRAVLGACAKLPAHVFVYDGQKTLAEARNLAIEIAGRETDYLLMLDPGDTCEGSLPHEPQTDVYEVWVHDRLQRSMEVRLFRSNIGIRYEGVEVDIIVAPTYLSRAIATDLVCHRGGNREEERRAKAEVHIAELLAWVSDKPEDAHACFVLGQAYRDAGEYEKARGWYEKRLSVGDRENLECFAAALELAFLTEHHSVSAIEEVTGAYLRAHELSPLRAEPLFHLACYLREHGAVASAWHFARRASELKVPPIVGTDTDLEIYEWKALAELAIESWMLGDSGTAVKLLTKIGSSSASYTQWAEDQIASISNGHPPARIEAWPESRPLR